LHRSTRKDHGADLGRKKNKSSQITEAVYMLGEEEGGGTEKKKIF